MANEPARIARMEERVANLKAVAKWHFRHFSVRQIADKTGLSTTTVQKYIAIVKDRMQGMEDVDSFIRDVVSRTMEEIDRLGEQEMKLWEMLDWASTLVPDYRKMPRDDDEGDQYKDETGKKMMKPRSPGYMTQATGQLLQIQRQRSELLKLIGNKVDISVNLQFAQKTQVLIMEKMKELDPNKYGELVREIEVLAEQFEKSGEKIALNPAQDEIVAPIIEGEYEVV